MTRAAITAGAEAEAEVMIAAMHAATEMAITTVGDAAELEVAPDPPDPIGPVMTEIAGTAETVAIETTAVVPVITVETAARTDVLALVTPPRLPSLPRTSETDGRSSASNSRID